MQAIQFVSIHLLRGNVADPHHVDANPDPAFHFDADPDPTFQFDPDPDPTTHFSPVLQNDPLRLLLVHFDVDPDPDRSFHIDADPDPASQNDVDSCGSGPGSATLLQNFYLLTLCLQFYFFVYPMQCIILMQLTFC
jgi:hypothetical protein